MARRRRYVERQFKPELLKIEMKAALLIADENSDCAQTNVKALPVGMKTAPMRLVLL